MTEPHESDHDRIIRLEERLLCAITQYEQYAILSDQKAMTTATYINERLERMNEFRGALQDAQSHFVTKDFYERAHADLEHRVDLNGDSIVALRLKQSADEAASSGQRVGTDRLQALIFAFITAVAVIVSVIVALSSK